MPSNAERSVTIKTTTILKVIAVFLVLGFFWLVRDILALLVVGLFLAALMHPAVRWAGRYRVPKGLMVLGIYLGMFILMSAAFALIIPTLIEQIGNLAETIGPSVLNQISGSSIVDLLNTLSSTIQRVRESAQQGGLAGNISAGFATLKQISQTASGFFGVLVYIFGGLVGLAVVLVIAFYIVVQDKEAIQLFYDFVPKPYQERSAQILIRVEEKIGRWLRGQIVLSLIIGVLYYIGLLILGVDNALALAIFAAFVEFIPYLGPILGGIPIVIVALSGSPLLALLSLILVIIVQQLESQIIVPKVMEKALGLNPLASIVAVLIGAKLFGIVGALLSIPLATALSVVLTELYRYRNNPEA